MKPAAILISPESVLLAPVERNIDPAAVPFPVTSKSKILPDTQEVHGNEAIRSEPLLAFKVVPVAEYQ